MKHRSQPQGTGRDLPLVAIAAGVVIAIAVVTIWGPLTAVVRSGTVSVDEVRGVWRIDPQAMRSAWGGEFGMTDADLQQIEQRLGSATIDLSGLEAIISIAGTKHSLPWHATPAQGKAETIAVSWDRAVPILGTGTSFTRVEGHLAIANEGALLLVRRNP